MCIKPYLKQVEGVGRVVTLKKLSVLITYSITVGVVTRQKIQGGRGWGLLMLKAYDLKIQAKIMVRFEGRN